MSGKWNQPASLNIKKFNPNLSQDFKKFGKEVVKSDVFKKARAFKDDSVDILAKNLKNNSGVAASEVKQLSKSIFNSLNENRFVVMCGIAGLSLIVGALTIATKK